VQAEWGGEPTWHALARIDAKAMRAEAAGRVMRITAGSGPAIERLRIVLRTAATGPFDVDRIALLP
jgi:hypothetical protein